MKCELCGSGEALFVADVEGGILNLCNKCSKYGKVLRKIKPAVTEKPKSQILKKEPKKELIEEVVSDYPVLIKEKREALGLNQEDFAKQISEKVSLIHKIETGHIVPSIPLARKIERFLKIKLVEELEEEKAELPGRKRESLTIGDLLKIKK